MAIVDGMDLVLRLKFEAAIRFHAAKKATNKRLEAAAREKAEALRQAALELEAAQRQSQTILR